ncbi:hypothetical protein MVEN_02397700 [Mycena venus]|uniref:Uncharacterized protein n=1 Tax=Mycena venus TaxID=2733690 RepID=A0A8H6X248_9AGAR|nr:hypothetical protein MVEN_02397700 [Mycena venus]
MSPQDLESFSSLRQVYPQVAVLSVFLNGLYTAVFLATVYGIVMHGRGQTGASRILVHIAILLMYASSAAISWILWIVAKNAFITSETPKDTLAYLLSTALPRMPVIALSLNTLLADCILVWRCYVVWNRKVKMVLLPAVCALGGGVIGFIAIAIELQLGIVPTPEDGATIFPLGTTYFILTLVSQLSATLLIIYRIFSIAGRPTHRYARVVEMVVESAAPNCIILIVLIPFFLGIHPLGASYPQAILLQSVGIGPTLIAARVAFGMARSDDEWDTRPVPGGSRQASAWYNLSLTRISTQVENPLRPNILLRM